jgi:RNA polymerase sigma-70 factor (ECF subfamily)
MNPTQKQFSLNRAASRKQLNRAASRKQFPISSSPDSNVNRVDAQAVFATTRWSLVLAAGLSSSAESGQALAQLCRTYWYPLYAFVRRQGHSPQDAEDLTQAFFAKLLEKKILRGVAPEKGKFRSFLLASLKNFLANDWDRNHAAKRGGDQAVVSWDEQSSEDRYLQEPATDLTPEKLFDQSWALTVIESVLEQLRKEHSEAGKSQIFEAIQSYLEEEGADTYAEIAAKLGMTEGAVKMAVLRLRENFRQRLRSEIAQTVADATEIDEELRHLFACLST